MKHTHPLSVSLEQGCGGRNVTKTLLILVCLAPALAGAATVQVDMRNNFFSPASVTINVGDTVTWVQRGSGHDTVSFDGLWQSDILSPGQTFSFTFPNAGTFRYFCTPHVSIGMTGTVIVNAAANTPPTVVVTAPANGATFAATDTITLSANATDNGSVSKVEFFADGNLIGTATAPPYSVTVNLAAGAHTLTARATDNLNAATTSAAVAITVTAAVNQSPTITLTSPQNGKVVAVPGAVQLQATAADPDGTVAQVEFFNGTTSAGVKTASPFDLALNGLAEGVYSFTAVATDNRGAKTTSGSVQLKVAAAPKINSITKSGAAFLVSATGTSGIEHKLESSTDFQTWVAVETKTASQGAVSFTDASPADGRRFYRVVAQ